MLQSSRLQQQVEEIVRPGGPHSAQHPPAASQLNWGVLDEDDDLQTLLAGQIQAAEDMERSMARLVASVRKEVGAAQQLLSSWKGALRLQRNRLHNQESPSPLLRLPTELLHTICHASGRHTRLVSTAFFQSYLSPGTGIHLLPPPPPTSVPTCLPTCLPIAPPTAPPPPPPPTPLPAQLARWPWPAAITKLHSDAPLPPAAFASICCTFPALQDLSSPSGSYDYTALPPSLLALDLTYLRNNPDKAPFDLATIPHLTNLHTLAVHWYCELPASVAAVSHLVRLTSLTLSRGDPDEEVFEAYWQRADNHDLHLWPTFAALSHLPALEHLALSLDADWTEGAGPAAPGGGPGSGVLSALTYISVHCDDGMVVPAGGVDVQVVEALRRLPALVSLQLWEGGRLMGLQVPEHARSGVIQVLQERKLQNLDFHAHEADSVAMLDLGRLTPFLTSLSCLFEGLVTAPYVRALLLHPAHLITTFRLDGGIDYQYIAEIVSVTARQLTGLTELGLGSTLERDAPLPPAPSLSQLTGLRKLTLSGSRLVEMLGPSLTTLPALVSLNLPDATLPLAPGVFLALTALTALSLGAWFCVEGADAAAAADATRAPAAPVFCLPAVRQMRSLRQLVMDSPAPGAISQEDLKTQLQPPPPTLQKVVVQGNDRELCERIRRALGPLVNSALAAPFSSTRAW